MIVEPFAAMRAACLAIADGDAAEIELEWNETLGEVDARLTITVRREVKHFTMQGPESE